MFIINCPYCGERDQTEFSCGGEAHIERPKQPTELSDDQWAEYLFMRKILKVFNLKDGIMLMDAESGSIWLETLLTTKFMLCTRWGKKPPVK